MRRLAGFSLLILTLLLSPILTARAQQTHDSLTVNGVERTYTLYVPPTYDGAEPWPLVVGLHGRGGSGAGFAAQLDLNPIARDNDFITVYPDGINREWNYAEGTPEWIGPETDDVAFLAALVDALAEDFAIDRARVYVAGFSNGGFMTQRLACEVPDQYAAFAVISAGFYPGLDQWCATSAPTPILFMHGTADVVVPWTGTLQGQFVLSMPVEDTVAYWAGHDGCSPDEVTHETLDSVEESGEALTSVIYFHFGGCDDDTEVVLYAVEGGGHNVPGTSAMTPGGVLGNITHDVHAGEAIWTFFEPHALETPASGSAIRP
ncbi:extracellular catalytic domain type 1 short-chain-length polyhydroxyalkanoate depolymerase [Aggregatilinea lenta]|uniref:extracellular catalytic domain type 1 short-chain-length polyhydroxyalkanoate depolymerase n=1 Tax=Aggregatilinea lenta TaxID=913108 RepID=UPI000E5A3F90|nr:PHB depolymerase family esterase [Aggregatilinea lenta]